jgi:UDP-N-acetylmuramoylalanine--D-glutamate ligase
MSFDVIIGLGQTGISCARFLQRCGRDFIVMDSRPNPPALSAFQKDFSHAPVYHGFDIELLTKADRLIVSPGVSLQHPEIQLARAQGVTVLGDIALFVEHNTAPVIAISGSNGKSTVTTLLGEMITQAGFRCHLGGNIGIPALDLLTQEKADFVVLELSSFQLETTDALNAEAATVLNLSADHMDRYTGLDDYGAAKKKIFRGVSTAVLNRQDKGVVSMLPLSDAAVVTFGLDAPDTGQWGVVGDRITYEGSHLMAINELKLPGLHHVENALAALALGHAIGLPHQAMLTTLKKFSGLSHRTQQVMEWQGVCWINDSKGTNVGATLAAVRGVDSTIRGKVVLIAGGEGKGANFSPLLRLIENLRAVVVIGRDGPTIGELFVREGVNVIPASTMTEAVLVAARLANQGDAVLLSPACASFDWYRNFSERGDHFIEQVLAYAKT